MIYIENWPIESICKQSCAVKKPFFQEQLGWQIKLAVTKELAFFTCLDNSELNLA